MPAVRSRTMGIKVTDQEYEKIEAEAAARGGAVGFFEQDELGSVTSLTGSTGAVLNSYNYDAYGNVATSTGSFINPYQFTGRDYDPETGLRYYRARYYGSAIGRFISEYPVGFAGGINFYAYVWNEPTLLTDPSGWLPRGTDKWWGYNDRDFQKWFHRCWKRPGDPDASKEEIIEAYEEWKSRGKPKGGDCWNKRPECEEQPHHYAPPIGIPIVGPIIDTVTDPIVDRIGPLWDDLKNWRPPKPTPLSGSLPVPVPIPIPIPIIP